MIGSTKARIDEGIHSPYTPRIPILGSMQDTDSKPKPCQICGKPAEQMFRPFCSRRCADVDLHRWLSGAYAVPAVETDELPEEADKEPC